jgi:HPt (histidine-containing phosphotransfer) domain-containing protein
MNEPASARDILDPNIISNIKVVSAEVNPDFLNELIEMYIVSAPRLITGIKSHAAEGDSSALEADAHRLRGSSLNLGALRMAEVCGLLEKKGREDDREGLEPLVERLETDYGELLAELDKLKAKERGE